MNRPLIGHDGPKTVTFGAPPQDEAQYRSARLGSRVVGATLGVAAALLGVVALLFNLSFAADLAETWPEMLKLGLIAIALTLALAGAPVAAALMARTYPAEARQAMQFWRTALALSAIGMGFFVLTSSSTPNRATQAQAAERATELRTALGALAPGEWEAWDASNACASPPARWRASCADITTRREQQWAELQAIEHGTAGWSTRGILGSGQIAGLTGSDTARRLLVLALSLAAIAGAGLLGRLAVLASAESYRLAYGEATPAPTGGTAVAIGNAPALTSALETSELWFQGRVIADPQGRLSPTAAYADYELACSTNGLPAMPVGSFFNLLSAKAKASGGTITRVKSNGQNFYQGWSLGPADMGELPPAAGEMIALPYRS